MIISHLGNSTSAVIHLAHLLNITMHNNQKIIQLLHDQEVHVQSIIYFKVNPGRSEGDQIYSMLLDRDKLNKTIGNQLA